MTTVKKHAMPTLVNVLTPFPYHIEKDAPANEAKQIMAEQDIRHLVVVDNGDICGLLTERDVLHHLNLYCANASDSELMVSDICIDRVVVADINDPLDRVLDAMVERHLGCVVVLKHGELAGIFTTTDACKQFALFLKEEFAKDSPPDIIA